MGALIERYLERSRRLAPVVSVALREERGLTGERRARVELEALRELARDGEGVLLSERGESWTSNRLASYLGGRLVGSSEPTYFLLGSEEGHGEAAERSWRGRRLALSALTLPHELARLVLVEQVYRALAIIRNVKYHK